MRWHGEPAPRVGRGTDILTPMSTERSCPDCGTPMADGVIVGRSPGVKFKASQGILGDLSGVLLTTGFFNHTAAASRCPQCGLVLVPPRH